jgi:DNA-binding transcriptional LysR family regulator
MRLGAQLRAFGSFVRCGSFSDAAADLRISQPAVSKHIADMERDLGVTLIDRRTRDLTLAGRFLADHVLRAEALLAIRASGTPGTYLLPEVVAAFQKRHPAVRVEFDLGTSAEVMQAIRAHQAEIGVVGGFVAAPEIEAEPLTEDELVIVGSPDMRRRQLSRDELESMLWISREEGSATRVIADAALAELGIVPHRRLALPSWEAIKLAVARGHGIAAMNRHAVAGELKVGTLAVLPFAAWKVRRIYSIVRIRDAELTRAAQQFIELLRMRWSGSKRAANAHRTRSASVPERRACAGARRRRGPADR